MNIFYKCLFYLSLLVVHSQPNNNNIREEYNMYLNVFKKKETSTSYHIFRQNYELIQGNNKNYYLTQHSDTHTNDFYFSPTIYVYVLESRKKENQKVLLCV